MVIGAITQVSFIYVAQGVLAVAIGIWLRYYSRIYPRIYLNTWSYSALFFFLHAASYSFLASSAHWPFFVHYFASLASSIGNNLHLVLALIGCYEATHDYPLRRVLFRNYIWLAIVLAVVTTSSFAYSRHVFLDNLIYRIALTELLTGITLPVAGGWLILSRSLRGIGSKFVGVCLALYGLAHFYNFITVVQTFFGAHVSPPPVFGLLEVILIALVGFGLVIWLLEDERERLHKVNQQLDRFLYSTSHDLRAPISSVLGLINVARYDVKDTTTTEYLNLIEGRVRKLDSVIADILALSRVHKPEPKYEIIDFNSLLKESVGDLKFANGAIPIEFRYQEKVGNEFWGDYNLSKMVVGNLLSNAVKYHSPEREHPYVEVTFEKKSDAVVFTITDNGEGIPAEHQDRVFDMFYRASTSSQGTGLGLFIVKETLARIHGTIQMKSFFGVGTSFTVVLEQNGEGEDRRR